LLTENQEKRIHKTVMTQFCDDVLTVIFQFLDNKNLYRHILTICKSWHDIGWNYLDVAGVRATNRYGELPQPAIYHAVKHGYVDMVEKLLKNPKVDPFDGYCCVDYDCYELGTEPFDGPIYIASKNKNMQITRMILNSNPCGCLHCSTIEQILDLAIEYDDLCIVSKYFDSNNHRWLINYAVECGSIKVATFLIEQRSHQQIHDKTIAYAALHGFTKIVQRLLALGVDPSANQNLAIRYAIMCGYDDITGLLLEDERVASTWCKEERTAKKQRL
jgi:hypothetical protein